MAIDTGGRYGSSRWAGLLRAGLVKVTFKKNDIWHGLEGWLGFKQREEDIQTAGTDE